MTLKTATLVLSAFASIGPGQVQPGTPDQRQPSYAVVAPPSTINVEFLKEPPQLTAEQLAALERSLANVNLPPPVGLQSGPVAGPTTPETTPPSGPIAGGTSGAQPGPGFNRALALRSSTAAAGTHVFYVGNGFAARAAESSPDAWTFINSAATMPDFCCEQQVVADRARDILLWYRQGVYQVSDGQGRFVLGVTGDGGASFCTYSLKPSELSSSLTNRSWESFNLALTNQYLYVSVNVHLASGIYDRKVILRWPLDLLKSCSGFKFPYLENPNTAMIEKFMH